jgi:hypothetical protein
MVFPRDFFLDYWNSGTRDQVFVAMPFAESFDRVWSEAIAPAAEACDLVPFRVDLRNASDSILVDILDGVAHARLIIVDLSPVSCSPSGRLRALLSGASTRPQYPNGNVMYELGLAHAARQAEEVILVRNHTETRLLFDVSGVRVHSYQEDDMVASRATFEELMRDALATIDRTKALQVAKAVQAVTIDDIKLIRKYWPNGFTIFAKDPDGDIKGIPNSLLWATANLQKLGMLHASPLPPTGQFSVGLTWTEFGHAVVKALGPGVIQGRPDLTKPPEVKAAQRPSPDAASAEG